MLIDVYLPHQGMLLSIRSGSGVVGRPTADGIIIDHEGNKQRDPQVVTWADRVEGAARRINDDTSTTCSLVSRHALMHVGSYDTETGTIILLIQDEDIISWLGPCDVSEETKTTSPESVTRRALIEVRQGTNEGQALTNWFDRNPQEYPT